MIQSFAACRTYHFCCLFRQPHTLHLSAWHEVPSKTRTPYTLYAQNACSRGPTVGQVKIKPSSRSFELEAKSVKKQRNKKKACMTNDSASPFKVSSKLAPSFFQAQRLAPWTRQNQLTIFSLRGAQGQSPWVQYVDTSSCRGNTASELGCHRCILPWKLPRQKDPRHFANNKNTPRVFWKDLPLPSNKWPSPIPNFNSSRMKAF